MKLSEEQLERFDELTVEYARGLKNIFTFESTEKYLTLQLGFKYDAFLVSMIERYMQIPYEDIYKDKKLRKRFDSVALPIFRECVEEIKVEHEEKIKKAKDEEKERLAKTGHKRKRK